MFDTDSEIMGRINDELIARLPARQKADLARLRAELAAMAQPEPDPELDALLAAVVELDPELVDLAAAAADDDAIDLGASLEW